MNSKVVVVLVLVLVSATYIFFNSQKLKQLSQTEITTTLVNELPDMQVKTLAGEDKVLADFYNGPEKALIVHFWGTWCGPCETEFPSLIKLINALKDAPYSYVLVAINDKEEEIKKFLTKYSVPANVNIVLENHDQYMTKFGAAKVPETFIFNPNKTLFKHFLGPQDWESQYLTDLLKSSFK